MKLYYYKDVIGNFGDDLNSWLWDALIPDFFDQDESIRMSGIGTIINTAMPKADKWVVFRVVWVMEILQIILVMTHGISFR